MYFVAIHHLPADPANRAVELAQILGITAYEARPRLLVAGGGPAVVASFAEEPRATALAATLEAAGFAAFVFNSEDLAAPPLTITVRKFTLGPDALSVDSTGTALSIPYAEVALLLRGAGITQSVTTEKTSQKRFDVGRAVLSGGLVMTKTTSKTLTHTSEERRHFLLLHSSTRPVLVFNEAELLYDGLGSARQPTRQANFLILIGELRRRCPAARFDERLLKRAGQAQLLGPAFSPEDHLPLAAALLARSLIGTGS